MGTPRAPPRPHARPWRPAGGTHLHGRHSLGHVPAQRRLLVAHLVGGQRLCPAPAAAVQPQALQAQLLRLRPCGHKLHPGSAEPRSGRPRRGRSERGRLAPRRRRTAPSTARRSKQSRRPRARASQWPPGPRAPPAPPRAPTPRGTLAMHVHGAAGTRASPLGDRAGWRGLGKASPQTPHGLPGAPCFPGSTAPSHPTGRESGPSPGLGGVGEGDVQSLGAESRQTRSWTAGRKLALHTATAELWSIFSIPSA